MKESDAQRRYWNELAPEYHAVTRIDGGDFHYGPRLAGERVLRILPRLRKGWRALELGCGAAQNSAYLAAKGLACTAMDVSDEQIRTARKRKVPAVLKRGRIEDFDKRVKGERFNLIHSSHAFEFLENPATVIKKCYDALLPKGWLLISTVHPLYNGFWVEDENGHFGKFLPSYFAPPDDVREDYGGVRVHSRAWPIETWFRWLREAGFTVRDLREPAAADVPAYTSDAWEDDDGECAVIPSTVIFLAQR